MSYTFEYSILNKYKELIDDFLDRHLVDKTMLFLCKALKLNPAAITSQKTGRRPLSPHTLKALLKNDLIKFRELFGNRTWAEIPDEDKNVLIPLAIPENVLFAIGEALFEHGEISLQNMENILELIKHEIEPIEVRYIGSKNKIAKIQEIAELEGLKNLSKNPFWTTQQKQLPSVCTLIIKTRKIKGMTQKDLAKKAGIIPYYLSEIETGRRELTYKMARRIASALELDVNELLGVDKESHISASNKNSISSGLKALLDKQTQDKQLPPVCALIIKTRKKKGMTQKDLANKAGMIPGYLSEIETGRRELSNKMARRIASALELDVNKLLNLV